MWSVGFPNVCLPIQALPNSCRLWLLVLLKMALDGGWSDGCPSSSPKLTLLEESLLQAEQQMQDGRMLLPILDRFLPPEKQEILRAAIGTTVSFSCTPLATGVTDPLQLIWRHHNLLIYANSSVPPATSEAYFYTHAVHGPASHLFIHNESIVLPCRRIV
ncbi:uncharacterized protein LOC129599861 [Paramacrobiotus metropolitanus]|uniref:uncharacterized protein LOC129599861 n=1 Tax=Paramacrobiotus metropolitanus TaxID=2943436 RepID=UPI002445CDB9|nr:uncharacterized protein LOC129599861 [Paramacrobiotus metropolitanus]